MGEMGYEKLIKDLYVTRQNHKESRKNRIMAFQTCECSFLPETGYECQDTNSRGWCVNCIKKQFAHDKYRKRADMAGAALRKVLAAGKKLVEMEDEK